MKREYSRRYISLNSGQVHVLEAGPRDWRAPLYCLHATAYSGQTFVPLIQGFAGSRRLVAPDMPGYGGSDRPLAPWSMARYADSLRRVIDTAEAGPVDLLGYHTGAFVAAELAISHPSLVRRLVLIGVPFYLGKARAERRKTLARRSTLTEDFGQFAERWDYLVANRPDGLGLDRAFGNFVDELRAYPQEWWAHEAAFTYKAEQQLGRVTQPVLILNPDNHLAAPSREAAALMQDCRVVELPHLSHAIFDVAGRELAGRINEFLEAAPADRLHQPEEVSNDR